MNALSNLRALITGAFPDLGIKARSTDELLDKLAKFGDRATISAQAFRDVMWGLMEGEAHGKAHIALLDATEIFGDLPEERLSWIRSRWEISAGDDIETGSVLGARLLNREQGNILRILYLGETNVELADPTQNFNAEVDGVPYYYKAYLHETVPVIALFDFHASEACVRITIRPIHRGNSPASEISILQTDIEQRLSILLNPLPSIAAGMIAIKTRLTATEYKKIGTDQAKVAMTLPVGRLNAGTQRIEGEIDQWPLQQGHYKFDGKIPFFVDVTKGVFSFGASVTQSQVQNVIQTIIAAGQQ